MSDASAHSSGVPLGGVGTGYVEIDRRGRFRQFAINNNRTTETILPSAPGCFLGMRISGEGGTRAILLQRETELPIAEAGFPDACIPKHQHAWTPLYPGASFGFTGMSLPVECSWRVISPVIPFDTEASMLPAFLVAMDFTNVSRSPCDIAGLVSWENLRGRTATQVPTDSGSIDVALLEKSERYAAIAEFRRGLEMEEDEEFPIGLTYGLGAPVGSNSDGDYAVACAPRPDTPITYETWDPMDRANFARVWRRFENDGRLSNEVDGNRCGAVSQRRRLAPEESFRLIFVVSWYCPRFEVGGEDLGNAYTNEYTSAYDAALYAIEYQDYLIKAVDGWHARILDSTLPGWYCRMLINASSVLTTNSIHTAANEFSLFDSPDRPLCSSMDHHMFASIGTSIFFPTFAERELTLLSATDALAEPGGVFRHLGEETVRAPSESLPTESEPSERIDLYAGYVLTACRNFHLSGRLASIRNNYERLQRALQRALRLDANADGIPDAEVMLPLGDGESATYISGLWIATLLAYADIARRNDSAQEAARVEALAERLRAQYASEHWDEAHGRFGVRDGSGRTGLGQLAGPWLARFMHLRPGGPTGWPRPPFDDQQVERALKTLAELTASPAGHALVAGDRSDQKETLAVYPALTAALLACPLIQGGAAEAGLDILMKQYEHLSRLGRTIGWPHYWNAQTGAPSLMGGSHHVSSLSVWYSYFAILGFYMSVPDKTLFIAPNLPEGVHSLRAPLFTPVSLGEMRWSERDDGVYQQRVSLSFDSPIHIARLELGVPPLEHDVEVFIQCEGDVSRAKHTTFPGSRRGVLRIELNTNLLTQDPVVITVREVKPERAPADTQQ